MIQYPGRLNPQAFKEQALRGVIGYLVKVVIALPGCGGLSGLVIAGIIFCWFRARGEYSD